MKQVARLTLRSKGRAASGTPLSLNVKESFMKENYKQNCPLCANEAEYYFVDFDDKKYFKCQKCKKFLIDLSSEELIKEATKDYRNELSKMSFIAEGNYVLEVSMQINRNENHGKSIEEKYISKKSFRN